VRQGAEQQETLRRILAEFARSVTAWVGTALPRYAGGCAPDRVSFRPEEESTRKLRLKARNDLIHVDAFPGRPAQGRRILRVFANINPSEPRVWATAEPLPALLNRYRKEVENQRDWLRLIGGKVVELFRPAQARRSPSDWFMLRMHRPPQGQRRVPAGRPAPVALSTRGGLAGDDRRLQSCGAARPVRAGALVLRRPAGSRAAGPVAGGAC